MGSLFNPNVIRDMDFYAGAFPASFGDRLSSVLVINTTTGNPIKALETQVEVDATVAALTMKGALPFWESSWISLLCILSLSRSIMNICASCFQECANGNFMLIRRNASSSDQSWNIWESEYLRKGFA